jgi:hypothetical protein
VESEPHGVHQPAPWQLLVMGRFAWKLVALKTIERVFDPSKDESRTPFLF